MTDITNTVDSLGAINEEIKALEAVARKLKAELLAQGAGLYAGNMYKAEVQFFESELIKPDLVRALVTPEVLKQVTVLKDNERVVVRSLENII